MRRLLLLLFLLLLAVPAALHAQTVVGPTSTISFDASPDHAATNTDGSAVVTRYEFRFIPGTCSPTGTSPAVAPFNVGKPTPNAAGGINNINVPAFGTLTGNCRYTGSIFAIGPGGEAGFTSATPFWRPVAKTPAAPSALTYQP